MKSQMFLLGLRKQHLWPTQQTEHPSLGHDSVDYEEGFPGKKKRIKIWSEWWWNIHELELFVVPSSKQTHGKIKENVLSISCYKWNGNVESKLWKYFIRGNLCLNILNALYKEVLVKYCVTGYSLILSTICCILVAGNRFEIN